MSRPLRKPVRVITILPADLLERVKKFQHAHELDSRSDAIRWLLEDCLARAEASARKKG